MPALLDPIRPALPKRRLLLCSLAGAPFCRAAVSPAPASATFPLNDHMAAFWPLYDAAQKLPAERRAAWLLERFFEPRRALYRSASIRLPDAARLGRWLAGFEPTAPAVRQTHARFAAEFARVGADFQAACPDFDATVSPVYLLPSLGWFDGHQESDGTSLPLFFGIDQIVRLHGPDAALGVLMSHEIFHCYQGQGNPALFLAKTPPLYATLWGEGTAVYASERLHPSAALGDLLLHQEALLRDGPGVAPRVAAALRERLDSPDPADAMPYFMLGAKRTWPDMIGYYVGLLCAREIGRGMSLHDIAFLPADQVRARLDEALMRLATT